MNEVINHIKNTCPHKKNKARQALRNNRFDLYEWKSKPQLVLISNDLKNKCRPCSKKDVARYQKMIRKGSIPPAIVIDENCSILDGAHRLQSLINEGHTHIWAFVGKRMS